MAISPDIQKQLLNRLAKASDSGLTSDQITESTSLRDDLKLDSLEMVTLIFDLQDQMGVIVEDEELSGIASVGDLYRIVEAKLELLQGSSAATL